MWAAAALVLALAMLLVWPEAKPGAIGGWLARSHLIPHFETLDGVRVRYVRRGRGSPVVLIHGFASSIYTWRDVLPALAAEHDVLAFDLPGFGGSDIPPELAPQLYLRLVPLLLDRLGIDRADLVGNSLGGAVALAVAAEHPGRVDRLVLIDSAGYNFAIADRPWILRMFASGAGGLIADEPVPRQLVALGLRQVYFDPARITPEQIDEYLVPLRRPGAGAAQRGLLLSADSLGFPALISRVRAPTLVLWGRQDAWIPIEHADRFVAAIAGARLEVLEDCGHVPQEERPDEVSRLLRAFLARALQP